jgi:hypothetical protein
MVLRSIPHVADVHWIRGVGRADGIAPDLLIEVPHGATDTADFEALAALLRSPLPDGLVDFFHANTDVGAFELALAAAQHFVGASSAAALIVRSRIPRTFIDCNRRIDASPEAFRAGKVTPGLMPWATDDDDIALLRQRHAAYVGLVRDASAALAPGAGVLLLHSYAPRSVSIEVDLDVVKNLRRAYRPEIEATWPMRPEFDVITRDVDGRSHAPTAVVDALRAGLGACGWTVAESETYPLHPSTLAWDHVMQRPGRALCLEVRRDLLAEPFDPFVPMKICAGKVDRIARPLAAALAAWGPGHRVDSMPRADPAAGLALATMDLRRPHARERT